MALSSHSAGFWCIRSGIHRTIWHQPSGLHQLFFECFWGVLRDIWSSSKSRRGLGKVWQGLRTHWQKWCFYSWKHQFEFVQFGWGGGGPIHTWWQINSPPYDQQPPVSVYVNWYWNWGGYSLDYSAISWDYTDEARIHGEEAGMWYSGGLLMLSWHIQ